MLPFLIDTCSFWVSQVSQGVCLPLVADGCVHVGQLAAPTLLLVAASIVMGSPILVGLGTSVFSGIALSTLVRMGISMLTYMHVFIFATLGATMLLS